MAISTESLNHVTKPFESCLKPDGAGLFKPYLCPAGVLTIGWGHTNLQGRKFDWSARWTQAECDAALAEDMAECGDQVARLVRVPMEQFQTDAVVDLVFNIGIANFGRSTLLRKLNASDYAGAEKEFASWNKARVGGALKPLAGLTRRRASEAALFAGATGKAYQIAEGHSRSGDPMPQQVEIQKNMSTSKIGNTQAGVGVGTVLGELDQVNTALTTVSATRDNVHELGVTDVMIQLAHQPAFWILLAIGVAAGATWYWRYQHRQEGV